MHLLAKERQHLPGGLLPQRHDIVQEKHLAHLMLPSWLSMPPVTSTAVMKSFRSVELPAAHATVATASIATVRRTESAPPPKDFKTKLLFITGDPHLDTLPIPPNPTGHGADKRTQVCLYDLVFTSVIINGRSPCEP